MCSCQVGLNAPPAATPTVNNYVQFNKKKSMKHLTMLIILLFHSGSGSIKDRTSKAVSELEGKWRITSMGDRVFTLQDRGTITFTPFSDEKISGNIEIKVWVGCNKITAIRQVKKNAFKPNSFVNMTETNCGTKSAKLDEEMKTNFSRITHYKLESGLLLLKDTEDKIIFSLMKISDFKKQIEENKQNRKKRKRSAIAAHNENFKGNVGDINLLIIDSLHVHGVLIDARDRQTYKWIQLLDGKKWMMENLNYAIPESWCYDSDSTHCTNYGRLYAWTEAMKACPSGWHLPSDNEWWTMTSFYGQAYNGRKGQPRNTNLASSKLAYKNLMVGGTSGFSALPGGYKDEDGLFKSIGNMGYYWSSTELDDTNVWRYRFYGAPTFNLRRGIGTKLLGRACRCIED